MLSTGYDLLLLVHCITYIEPFRTYLPIQHYRLDTESIIPLVPHNNENHRSDEHIHKLEVRYIYIE